MVCVKLHIQTQIFAHEFLWLHEYNSYQHDKYYTTRLVDANYIEYIVMELTYLIPSKPSSELLIVRIGARA